MAKKAEENDGWLSKFHEGLQEQSKRREEEISELTRKLGQPDLFVPFDPDSSYKDGMGYWRIQGGICAYRFTPNGKVIPESRAEYTDEFVNNLHSLLSKTPRK